MPRKRSKNAGEDFAPAAGFFRLQIVEDGRVVGDSGWRKNVITNQGARDFLAENLMGGANSKRVTHMGIGTGAAPASNDTTLASEAASRVTTSTSTSGAASRTAQFTAQFASSVFSTWTPKTINNLGLFNSSSGGILFAGNTYTTSQWNTNQDVNATYQIGFPTT